MSPEHTAEIVKPDGAEYVVRLISVKPMQAAVEGLISLDEKWAPYRYGYGSDPEGKPTNLAEGRYMYSFRDTFPCRSASISGSKCLTTDWTRRRAANWMSGFSPIEFVGQPFCRQVVAPSAELADSLFALLLPHSGRL
jgi:hypothetical protein